MELLEEILEKENLNKEQKKKYQAIMEKQYQNLSYKITNEENFFNYHFVI